MTTTTELAAQVEADPRFRAGGSGLFTELAAVHGEDFTGIAFFQAYLKASQEPS